MLIGDSAGALLAGGAVLAQGRGHQRPQEDSAGNGPHTRGPVERAPHKGACGFEPLMVGLDMPHFYGVGGRRRSQGLLWGKRKESPPCFQGP